MKWRKRTGQGTAAAASHPRLTRLTQIHHDRHTGALPHSSAHRCLPPSTPGTPPAFLPSHHTTTTTGFSTVKRPVDSNPLPSTSPPHIEPSESPTFVARQTAQRGGREGGRELAQFQAFPTRCRNTHARALTTTARHGREAKPLIFPLSFHYGHTPHSASCTSCHSPLLPFTHPPTCPARRAIRTPHHTFGTESTLLSINHPHSTSYLWH